MPQGAGVLFLIQIFSTLSFSVLYSTLVLYTTSALHFNDSLATGITASFVAFHYVLHLFAGYIGGRFISYRLLFVIGLIAQFIGCLMLSLETVTTFYWGLASFLAGSGCNLTCINCMLTQLFKPDDKRRETAFLWNYSGMNIGFFAGFSLSGYFQLTHSYSTLFLLSSVSSIIAFLITCIKWHMLSDIQTRYNTLQKIDRYSANFTGMILILVSFFGLRWLLAHSNLSNTLVISIGILMICVIITLAMRQAIKENKHKIFAYLILASGSLVFWTLYQLAPIGLTLFIARNVNLHYYGFLIAPQWVQNINTIVIILGGPLLSIVFAKMREQGIPLTIPIQFSFALIMIGIALSLLPIGIHFANPEGYTNFNWVLVSFILLSIGELCIAPVGYAMIGQLAPINLQGILMGTWLMILGVASILSGYFSRLALGNTDSLNPLITNKGFSFTFGLLGLSAIAAGILLFICVPLVLKLMHEKQ